MKKKLLVTAILASIAGMAGVAHAQNSVTLYGVMDADVDYANHTSGGHIFKMNDGMDQGNRWGIRGTEELGNGLHAIFTAEGGFSVSTGAMNQGNSIFGRQIYVGLQKDGYGSLTFGRQYTYNTDWLPSYSTGGNTPAGNFAWHMADIDQLANSRINNAVKFTSDTLHLPNSWGNLQVGGLYGFSNVAGDFGGNDVATAETVANGTEAAHSGGARTYSFGLKYDYGLFGIGAAIMDTKNPAGATYYGTGSMSTFSTFTIGGINASSGLGVSDLRSFGIGAHYSFHNATVWALWTNTSLEWVGSPTQTFNVAEVGAKYNFTPAFSAGLGYTYSHLGNGQDTDGSAHWNEIDLTGDYAFTKRTDVYAIAGYQSASGQIGSQCAQATIGDSTSYYGASGACGLNQIAVAVGIRHKF